MADLRQIVFSQTCHLHDGIAVNIVLQHSVNTDQIVKRKDNSYIKKIPKDGFNMNLEHYLS